MSRQCDIFCLNFLYVLCAVLYCTDLQDREYHIALTCEHFKDVREKYVKQYYYNRPSMMKSIELMNTHNSKERFRFMLFLNYMLKPSNCITNYDE